MDSQPSLEMCTPLWQPEMPCIWYKYRDYLPKGFIDLLMIKASYFTCMHMQLEVAGRTDIPVAEGSHVTSTVSLSYLPLFPLFFLYFVLEIAMNVI